MAFHEGVELKSQQIHLDGAGDFVRVDVWNELLSDDKMERIKKVAQQLYEIIDTHKELVHLIQIGPVGNMTEEINEEVSERERA